MGVWGRDASPDVGGGSDTEAVALAMYGFRRKHHFGILLSVISEQDYKVEVEREGCAMLNSTLRVRQVRVLAASSEKGPTGPTAWRSPAPGAVRLGSMKDHRCLLVEYLPSSRLHA